MALRDIVVKTEGHNGLKFPEHQLTHRLLDGLRGLELGPASHNSFNLEGSRSVAPADDFDFYKGGQIFQNGRYIETDIVAEACSIPVPDGSEDYVLSSHVLEHIPDIFTAFCEWTRVVRNKGYIGMIVPQRDALETDRGRALTTYERLLEAFINKYTPETMPEDLAKAAVTPRGHYWVFTSQSLKAAIEKFFNDNFTDVKWVLVAEEDPDQKVGNGFCLYYQVVKNEAPVAPKEETPEIETKPILTEEEANLLYAITEEPPEEAVLATALRKRRSTKKATTEV